MLLAMGLVPLASLAGGTETGPIDLRRDHRVCDRPWPTWISCSARDRSLGSELSPAASWETQAQGSGVSSASCCVLEITPRLSQITLGENVCSFIARDVTRAPGALRAQVKQVQTTSSPGTGTPAAWDHTCPWALPGQCSPSLGGQGQGKAIP